MGAGIGPSGSDVAHRGNRSQLSAKGAGVNGALRPFWAGKATNHYAGFMCRNIRTLHNFEPSATEDEVRASALQYVRKISGFTKPSKANEAAFEAAIEAVTAASAKLLGELTTSAPAKNREVEAAKARARAAERYAA
jgi:hypothetical protein